jgi:hypothetical protein
MESLTTDQCSWCHRSFATTTTEAEAPESPSAPETEAAEAVAQTIAEAPSKPIEAAAPPPAAEESVEPIAPWTVAPPAPAPASEVKITATEDSSTARPIIGVRRPAGGRGGALLPAPAMPPPIAKSGTETARSSGAATRTHVPAPGIPPVMGGNRAGGSSRSAPAPVASSPAAAPAAGARSSRVAVPEALARGPLASASIPPVSVAESEPAEAPVGLAAGVAVPVLEAPLPTAEELRVPEFGTFTPTKSKYYGGQVIDPVSGTHYDSDTGLPMEARERLAEAAAPAVPATTDRRRKKAAKKSADDVELQWDDQKATLTTHIVRYLVVLAVLLAGAWVTASLFPQHYVVPMIIVNFLGAMLLPIMRVVPWADEDSGDTIWFVLLTLVFGPGVSLIFYLVIAALRQDANPAIVGCFLVALASRLTVEFASGSPNIMHLTPWEYGHFDIKLMLLNWASMVTLAGWYCASVFHKLDD